MGKKMYHFEGPVSFMTEINSRHASRHTLLNLMTNDGNSFRFPSSSQGGAVL